MAKSKINRSAAIREYLKENRKAKAQEVVDALAAQGIEVTAGLVYMQKGRIKSKRGRRVAAIAKASRNGAADAVALIKMTRALAVKAGGINKLKELLEVLG